MTGHSSIFAVPDVFHMRAIAAHVGDEGPLRHYPLEGELYPAHAGATSKAYFAHLPDQERFRMFQGRPMARFTPHTTVDPSVLEEEFARVRRQGYAVTVGEYDPGVSAIAVLVSLRGEPFASLSLGGHDSMREDIPRLVQILDPARRELERRLVGRG